MNLERNMTYSIDKKTVKKMIDVLQQEDLVHMKDIRITIDYGGASQLGDLEDDNDSFDGASLPSTPMNSEGGNGQFQVHFSNGQKKRIGSMQKSSVDQIRYKII